MIYLLLLISFIIHLLTFVVIKQLKEHLARPDQIMSELTEKQKEIEDLLAVYLLEMREENIRLESLLNQDEEGQVPMNEEKLMLREKENNYQAFRPIVSTDKKDIVEQSTEGKVLSLYENGESVESIARKLNRGKTEIELYLKFSQNKIAVNK